MPQYKICFLGYKQLTSIAQQVVPTLPFDDCEIQIVDCLPDTLPEIVDGMMAKGFEVFIAGSSNAAAFSQPPVCPSESIARTPWLPGPSTVPPKSKTIIQATTRAIPLGYRRNRAITSMRRPIFRLPSAMEVVPGMQE